MSAPTASALKTMEAMAFCVGAPALTVERVDALIDWATTGKPPANQEACRGDLLHALYRLRLHMTAG